MNPPDRRSTGRSPGPRLPAGGAAGRRPTRALHRPAFAALLGAAAALPAPAAPVFTLPQYPLFLTTPANPNALIMLDNSQSMDATMAGKMVSVTDANTRSNIARNVLRSVLDTYRYNVNWGLGSFDLNGTPALAYVYGYYLGDATTMGYTNVCTDVIDGVGTSDKTGTYTIVVNGVPQTVTGKLPCIGNPDSEKAVSGNGYAYLTFSRSGDDADINDAFYQVRDRGNQLYGIGTTSSNSYVLVTRRNRGVLWTSPVDDVNGEFLRTYCLTSCDPPTTSDTDAGWTPNVTLYPNAFFLKRGQGYNNDAVGTGIIEQRIVNSRTTTAAEAAAENTHFLALKAQLAAEDTTPASASLKNAARSTPLAGAVATGFQYFSGAYEWKKRTDVLGEVVAGQTAPSPIQQCQDNFLILATDGNPTKKKDGSAYLRTDVSNTLTNGEWSFGQAARDVFAEIDTLRALSYNGKTYDVKTYVVGMGTTLNNPGSVAALNEMARRGGTGSAYLAASGDALTKSFQSIVSQIQASDSTAAAVTLSATSFQAGSKLYQARFNSTTWSGTLWALSVNEDGTLDTVPTWDAGLKVTEQDWNTGRAILTYKPSAALGHRGVAFRWPADPSAPTPAEIDVAQAAALDAGPTTKVADGAGALRLNYLRGDASHEEGNTACTGSDCAVRFHPRTISKTDTRRNVLGDIVNSAPAYVGAPSAGYASDMAAAPYAAFAATHAGRPAHLYVGANDGMLHAINAATGRETFAYVPNLVFSSLSWQTKNPYDHQYTVDGSPSVGDVFFTDAGAWRTLLVAGLRAGGKGLYALDVTDPSQVNEANAVGVVRWELSDNDLGHVFSKPALVKTNNGRWSVIAGNGYNATAGNAAARPSAMLFVIDAETGAVTAKIDTGSGSASSPNGLSGASPVDLNGDDVVDAVYAGDLDGNLWKFDLSSSTPGSWSVATGGVPLFVAGSAKPITVAPDVARHPRGGVTVVFATGRFLAASDLSNTAGQTAYGLWDKLDGTAISASQLQPQVIQPGTVSTLGDEYRFSTHRVGIAADGGFADDVPTVLLNDYYLNKRGWSIDLPSSGERVIVDPVVRGGRAIFTSMIPVLDSCEAVKGSGWVLEVDVITGNRLDNATFDTNNNIQLNTSDFLKATGTATNATNTTGWRINALPGGPGFMTFQQGTQTTEIKYVPTAQGTIVQKREGPGTLTQRRVMWRVVQ